MNEEREKKLAEWYGTGPFARPEAEPPACAQSVPPRSRHLGWKITGLCVLAVFVIAATALLFSSGVNALLPMLSEKLPPEGGQSMEEFFEEYFDESQSAAWTNSMPRAETGTGVELALTPRPAEGALELAEVYERCGPSVVAITTVVETGKYLWGSGIIMTEDGYILTNSHVLEGAVSATVTLWDDREYEASLVGADSASDVAVIKIEAVGLPAAEFCGDTVTVGEAVAAIGNPLGPELRGTMTNGIISALSRDISYTNHPMTLIQTNVAINEGNSGGPLLNMYGQVVGITSMKLVSSYAGSSIDGIGFAIPVETIKEVADALIRDGRVLGRPALGVTVGAVPAKAAEYYDIPDGLYVISVNPGSGAEAVGVRRGDIVVSADGEHVSEIGDLAAVIDRKEIGQTVSLELYRDGEMIYLDVELSESA